MILRRGAANFHGVQRHSADIDFWIETTEENLNNLAKALKQLEYDFDSFPKINPDFKQRKYPNDAMGESYSLPVPHILRRFLQLINLLAIIVLQIFVQGF
jgi:hypothetical protein